MCALAPASFDVVYFVCFRPRCCVGVASKFRNLYLELAKFQHLAAILLLVAQVAVSHIHALVCRCLQYCEVYVSARSSNVPQDCGSGVLHCYNLLLARQRISLLSFHSNSKIWFRTRGRRQWTSHFDGLHIACRFTGSNSWGRFCFLQMA